MKNKVLNLLCITSFLGIMVACNNEVEKKTITYYYNDPENTVYQTQQLAVNEGLIEPEEPNRKDLVFDGWYLDKEGKNAFEGFNKPITEDLTLYASWYDYDDLEDYEKIQKFIDKLQSAEGNVSAVTQRISGTQRYYTPVDYLFPIGETQTYHRYEDILTVDKYSLEDAKEVLYEQQQFFYDQDNFYSLTKDIENSGRDDAKVTSKYNKNKVETFLNIGFTQMSFACLRTVLDVAENGASHTQQIYDISGLNYTDFSLTDNSYEFSFDYIQDDYSEELGAYVTQVFQYEVGVSFLNKKISRSNVREKYIFAIDDEAWQVADTYVKSEYTITDKYEAYSGTRFNPDDFPVQTAS